MTCCKVETNRTGPTIKLILEQRHEGEGVSYVDIWQKRVPSTENCSTNSKSKSTRGRFEKRQGTSEQMK